MKLLVTGGCGFIGSNLAAYLAERGEQVRILDNFSSGRRENVEVLPNEVEVIEGDIRDYWTVVDAVREIDYVLHQAALPSVPRSVKNPLTSNSVNIDGTLNVLEAAKNAGVKKFVFASSSSVFSEDFRSLSSLSSFGSFCSPRSYRQSLLPDTLFLIADRFWLRFRRVLQRSDLRLQRRDLGRRLHDSR